MKILQWNLNRSMFVTFLTQWGKSALNFVAISSLAVKLLKKCRVRYEWETLYYDARIYDTSILSPLRMADWQLKDNDDVEDDEGEESVELFLHPDLSFHTVLRN